MVSKVLDDESAASEIELTPELAPTKIVDLNDWFVPVAETSPTVQPEPSTSDHARQIEKTEAGFTLPTFYFTRSSQPAREVEEIQMALDFG